MTGPGADAPVVEIRGLRKRYEPLPRWARVLLKSGISSPVDALRGIDLRLERSQMCVVVGPNGAGKTTLFRVIVGLTTATDGLVQVLGRDVHTAAAWVRRNIGWMPANDRSLFLRLSCYENLRFHGTLHGVSIKQLDAAIPALLEQVGLGIKATSAAFSLSAGQRARLQLARAMLHAPPLLILDEPTGTIDPLGAHELLELIQTLVRERGMAALISSHRLEEIEALESNAILLDDGRTLYQGDLAALRSRIDRPLVELRFSDPAAALAAQSRLNGATMEADPTTGTVRVFLAHGEPVGDLLARLGELTHLLTTVSETIPPLRTVLSAAYGRGAGPEDSAPP